MNNLKTVLENLKSDKVKDRQEAITAIRTIFAQDHVVAKFHISREGKSDPRMWLSVFQALFTAVLTEKMACVKTSSKTTHTAERRIAEAASVVRWLTERTVGLMNKRVTKALFEHLTQIMVHKDELFMPVALDYIKALKCLVNHTPHLEHLEDNMWVKLVEMGFNVVLRDPIRQSFWDDDMSVTGDQEISNSDLYQEDEEEADTPASPTKKRRRREESEPPQVSTSRTPAKRKRRMVSVSHEQVEFASLLAIVLRSPSTPILSYRYDEKDVNNHLASSILNRLQRFLVMYPADSSFLQDFLSILSSTLSHLALNRRRDVEDFACAAWDGLVGLWGMKDRRLKESLVVVLHVLFHFVTSEDESSHRKSTYDCIDGIGRLWTLLDGEADSRWGVDVLSFESLRLELSDTHNDHEKARQAFVAGTYGAGWNFDANQVLSWAVLELQADCASKLYLYSESMQTSTSVSGTMRSQGKKPKLENPILSLLSSIKLSTSANVRIYRLQILLFLIERHWSILHTTLRQEVMDILFQYVSYEDGAVQSWVLLCMAAVAHAECCQMPLKSTSVSSLDPTVWDSIWSHSIRRVNVPLVSRAACHTAHVLLALTSTSNGSTRLPLSPQRILGEIEMLVKDIDVQGPLFPYDSVCMFLAHCLRAASQDVRLYRMHLEDKILSWLVDNWKISAIDRGRMPLHQITDILMLLENVCGFTQKTDFMPQQLLPDSLIVHTHIEEQRTGVVRDLLLRATVPPFDETTVNANDLPSISVGRPISDLVQPRMRERKVSAFFQRSLEVLAIEWEAAKEDYTRLAAETARRTLDLAVMALAFESLRIINGINLDRRVAQCATKLIVSVVRALKDAPWTVAEKALVSLGLEPLVLIETDQSDHIPWQAMLAPNAGTGIKKHILHRLTPRSIVRQERQKAMRMDFLRVLWQIGDVQDQFFGEVMPTLRAILHGLAGETHSDSRPLSHMAVNKDDFEPIRTTSTQQLSELMKRTEDESFTRCVLNVCIGFLTVGPSLHSASGEATRDKELVKFVLNCAENRPEQFLTLCPMLLIKVSQRVLYLSVKTLDTLLNELSRLLQLHAYARSSRLQLLAIQLLQSTMELWLTEPVSREEVGDKIRQLCEWLSGALRKKKICSWLARDSFARFLDEYLAKDPTQNVWSVPDEQETDDEQKERLAGLPGALLVMMNLDEDIRVRFRVATLIGRLFTVAHHVGLDALATYTDLQKHLTNNLDNFEHMITRMLALGNIMVISSAVRRGAYWHILETCFFTDRYHRHIEAILNGVSQRMGLSKLSHLFRSYASQLAYSICRIDVDVHQLAPELLGYRDRLECAESTFLSFTPTNIVERRHLFEKHCAVLQKPVSQGIQECFGDIVGLLIVMWMADPEYTTDGLEGYLSEHTVMNDEDFKETFRSNIDRVIASVLRALGDQDISPDGPIITALRDFDPTGGSVHTFRSLTRYRTVDDFWTHPPNLPAHPTAVILRSLNWIASRFQDAGKKATTYHVLHGLLAQLHSSPLLNEQHRLVNALTLWIALHHYDFKDLTLLHTLVHGATSTLVQSDLGRVAQSWLDWAFRRYTKERLRDKRLSNILIRIACYANEHARNTQDVFVARSGSEILQWLDAQVLLLEQSDARGQILQALSAWPQPSEQLANLFKRITAGTLSGVLNDHRIMTNKFRTVHRLRDQAISEGWDEIQFGNKDFWRLKDAIPMAEDLQFEDAEAFAALLVLNKGRIKSFGTEQPPSDTMRNRHRSNARHRATEEESIMSARSSIVFALLNMLDGDSAPQVYLAYQTMRWVMSVLPTDTIHKHAWAPEWRDELECLQQYKWISRIRLARNLHELRDVEDFIDSARDFSRWISMLTVLLTDVLGTSDVFYAQLTPLLESDVSFSEQVLPILVHRLLQSEMKAGGSSDKTLLSDYFTRVLSLHTADVSCIKSIVDVVLHLRHFSPGTNDALANNKWLEIDYSLLAKNALKCGAYTTALLFLELTFEFKTYPAEEPSTEEILYEIYSHIDEPDGFYGIKSQNLQRFLIKRFHHEGQWDKAFRFHAAALEAGAQDSNEAEGLLEAFHAFGFDRLAIDTLSSSSATAGNITISDMNYRLGWRTETWDLPDKVEKATGASLYHALRSVYRERDPKTIDHAVRTSLLDETLQLRLLGTESLAKIREVMKDVMCLSQIIHWRLPSFQDRLNTKQTEIRQWSDFVNVSEGFDFPDLESIMATRIALIRSARKKEERQQIGAMATPHIQCLVEIEKCCLVQISQAAREANQVQIALNAIVRAQRLESTPTFQVSQEFAQVLWLQNEEKLAIEFLQHLLSDNKATEALECGRKATLLAQLGAWSAEACLEKPNEIRERFFEPAILQLQETGRNACDTKATVYHHYAVFSERQYHAILKSPDLIRWKVYVQRKTQEIKQREQELLRTQSGMKANSLRIDQDRARKLLQQDSELFRKYNLERDTFLKQAIDMYARCLESSDKFDSGAVIRLCSLWFANFEDEAGVYEDVELALGRIPSRKMVFLAHQLSARLSKPMTGHLTANQSNLQRLILRMCREHPFHSLYQVYCLQPDRLVTTSGWRHSGRHATPPTQTERTAAAAEIFERLRQEETTSDRVRDIEFLCNACLEWAKYPITKDSRFSARNKNIKSFKVPEEIMLRKVSKLKVPVMTYHTPVDPTMKYDNCIWVDRYETIFETAGGINLPKISICYGSDGQKYKQLFKGEGNDDLRQDAVMEQVFDLVNYVLHRDRETRKRDLKIRGYKVIPLSSQAGLLEFVVNTSPIREFLYRAHEKYRPNDLKAGILSGLFKTAQLEFKTQPHKLVANFKELLSRFQPVMRHCFTERHQTPLSWFAMRLNYTRSVASSSIVGHVLGLGDRHTSNILIDNKTGEVVHIDLGIAFDQGKLLPTPERVPFRLTGDMIDGMGSSGTQGVFQRCAEETLRVLRDGSEVIMTVLEVFKHDPLHSWTASEIKVKQVQDMPSDTTGPNATTNDTTHLGFGIGIDMSSGTADEAADRALSSVARKLDKSLSVQCTVNELIAEATDPLNLASIFVGWQPYF
ncbi:hypothetical protein AX17_004150 [Amanita inopinata Kibby_2008]|nr:hypothetical protein AX17_004150 [Amanita inopinata Kibby_2008]